MTALDPDPTDPGGTALERERLIELLTRLVEPIGLAMPSSSEIVLHDLSKVPNTVIAIHGTVTGRRVGDPGTDFLLKQSVQGFPDTYLGYDTTVSDGRVMRSWTVIVRDSAGVAAAALCINTDLTTWSAMRRLVDSVLGQTEAPRARIPVPMAGTPGPDSDESERFVHNVDELASLLIHRSIAQIGIPVEEMRKAHKVEVVRSLREQGFFQLREAVELVAEVLEVTRFTVYNYLNEFSAPHDR